MLWEKKRAAADALSAEAEIRTALRQWKDAVQYFENVRDPDLVDYAVYEMETARRKYVLLLKRYGRAEGEILG